MLIQFCVLCTELAQRERDRQSCPYLLSCPVPNNLQPLHVVNESRHQRGVSCLPVTTNYWHNFSSSLLNTYHLSIEITIATPNVWRYREGIRRLWLWVTWTPYFEVYNKIVLIVNQILTYYNYCILVFQYVRNILVWILLNMCFPVNKLSPSHDPKIHTRDHFNIFWHVHSLHLEFKSTVSHTYITN